jgi:predicted O-methyltransferase YrrM
LKRVLDTIKNSLPSTINNQPFTLYSHFQLAKKYLQYYLKATNSKGHGMHSPFVYTFIEKVLNDKTKYETFEKIEMVRKSLLRNKQEIEVEDFGAGSNVIKTKKRFVKNIAASSLKPKKFSQLLYRIVQFYNHKNILELGTSLGITTAYLAAANNAKVTSMEGSKNIANIAVNNFETLQLKNINLIVGEFEKTLNPFLQKNDAIDLAFLDGNHRKEPTLQYFKTLLPKLHNDSFLIFDDIHWSKEMEEAWSIIKENDAVTMSIDLFFIGIVFFKKEFKIKQHFSIRF